MTEKRKKKVKTHTKQCLHIILIINTCNDVYMYCLHYICLAMLYFTVFIIILIIMLYQYSVYRSATCI